MRLADRCGFTLVEVAMVVAIIAAIAVFAVQRMSKFAQTARIAAAESDLKTIASAICAPVGGYIADMQGIPGFSPAYMRIANLLISTNLYGAVAAGDRGSAGVRVDDSSVRRPGVAAADEFTKWNEERARGWRGPYIAASNMEFPRAGSRRFSGDATFEERGFYPPLSGLWLPADIVNGVSGCSVYGFPGEPAVSDPWGNPYVLQIPPAQAFYGYSTNVADEVRFSYARIVSAGPNGILETPCYAVNMTNSFTTSWTERTRRLSRQAGLVDGTDRAARGDDIVWFLRRADVDEGEAGQ